VRNLGAALPTSLLRGAALFLAAFTFVGEIGVLRGRTIDLSLWWIDLRDLPSALRLGLLTAFAVLLGTWSLLPRRRRWLGPGTMVVSATFALLAVRDAIRFYGAVGAGDVRPFIPVPLSVPIAVVLGAIAVVAARDGVPDQLGPMRRVAVVGLAAAAWAIVFPLAQMLFFGTTDYRRPADAAVIFGARVYADGRPSALLADRIRTGVGLYQSGLVPLLVMSGGTGSDGFNEALVMRDVAVAAGVAPTDVLVDPNGTSTEATVRNVMPLLAARPGAISSRRVIAVSQAYHLPRVQLAFGNAGIDVLTVPAAASEPISEMPILVAREIPAFWAYYLRVCLG
jgi:vancomycin permeability regulator SanA